MFLSRQEVAELTGYKQPKCQIDWLTRNGVRHWVARTGWPKVPRSAIDQPTAANKDGDEPGFELGHVA